MTRLEQKFDKYGDPINAYANYDEFEKAWIKENGEPKDYGDRQFIKMFYDDFKHMENMTIEEYLKTR